MGKAWRIHEERLHALRKRLEKHWYSLLYLQLAVYAIVLFLWALPVPNPVKVVSVTFHELSHGIAALLTGGRVFGFAISPEGSGVTFGVGGNLMAILIAGYLGSAFWGSVLFWTSVRWRGGTCLVVLEVFIIVTGALGWLNADTLMFGLSSLAVMTALFWMPEWIQTLFVRLLGSACCLHAPLEVLSDTFSTGFSPAVMGYTTPSDVSQIAEQLHISPVFVALPFLLTQFALVILLSRWTCSEAARALLSGELRRKKFLHRRLDEVRSIQRTYTLKPTHRW